jgi:hypothetical protein
MRSVVMSRQDGLTMSFDYFSKHVGLVDGTVVEDEDTVITREAAHSA